MIAIDNIYIGNNTLQSWLFALGITCLIFVISATLKRFFIKHISVLVKKTTTEVDDLIIELLRKVHFWFLLLLSVYAGSFALTIPSPIMRIIQGVSLVILLLQAAILGNVIISFWLSRIINKKTEGNAASVSMLNILGFISRLILWSIILLLALDNLGVDITALLAGLGVGGVAVALALQNILGDLFSSLSIVIDKPFIIGDFIIIDQYLGSVEHIGLKTTRIRSLSGEQIIFSNSDLLKSRIRNYKRMTERRIAFSFGVTYQTTHQKLMAIPSIVRDIIEAQPLTRFDRAHFKEYGDSALIYEVVYYLNSSDYNIYMDTQQAINLELFRRFEEADIAFAYPTHTIYVHQETPENSLRSIT